ncbi:MAG: flagellar basal-body rod protein FlgF [Pirellulales bacterium]|nr:flagellar basal-body rod protein FlgF [Pirellulales bacterium]
MPYGLYMSAEGALAQDQRLSIIANNLANVETTGFKKDLAVFQARYAQDIQDGQVSADTTSIENQGGGINILQTTSDFSQGPLETTGIPTDMAIRGEGFFVVEKEGEHFLTRAGNFRLTEQGQLVTQQGYPVLNDSMSPVIISPTAGPWDVSETGTVRQAGTFQNLALVMPKSYGDLVKHGENLFRPLADTQALPLGKRSVASEYLEGSSVNPTTEMVEMITASRLFEANTKMVQTQDQMLGNLIGRLMKVG